MSSKEQLLQRIVDLSSNIEQHQDIIRTLQIRRSDARRALNALSDPVARLPVEVASDIFRLCVPDDQEYAQPDHRMAPLLLLRVCHQWRAIALARSALWATIELDMSRVEQAKQLTSWLDRAGNHPLSLCLHNFLKHENHTNMKQRWCQLRTLELQNCPIDRPFRDMLPSATCLHTLKLFPTSSYSTFADLIKTLRCVPSIVHLVLGFVVVEDSDEEPLDGFLTLPSLRHLYLGRSDQAPCTTQLLKHLTLPVLEDLYIPEFDISEDALMAFLARSSPPLRSLHIAADSLEEMQNEYLRLVPSLRDLTLECRSYSYAFSSCRKIVDFLPNLRHLTVLECFLYEYRQLTMVLAEHPLDHPLSSLRVVFPYESSIRVPAKEHLVTLRQLAQDRRLFIHVGPKELNYVTSQE
ncbi:hypothetical protein R3P38DRAFT_1881799 [Favolaschia claudopus]|uniref:F-box domain-containing protein n=1 Tax=Favolaschia claudopus TaxID=2862362 RepID=A0AAW0DCI5_9AGAR